jgi:hypothetical protein
LTGIAAAALAGTAYAAATAKTHVMTVPLADGSTVRVEYVGEVAPKVSLARPMAQADNAWGADFPSFAGFDRMIEQMQRQSEEMIRQAREAAQHPSGAAPYIASYGNLPAGGTSTTVVSVSNGGQTCTRTTEVVSQGPGKPPKVTSNVTGQCGDGASPRSGAAGNPA